MKKLFTFIMLLFVFAFGALAVNVNLNISFRYWLKSHFEQNITIPTSAKIIFANGDQIYEQELNEIADLNSGKIMIPIEWLREMGFTYALDDVNGDLSLVGHNQFLKIALDGQVLWNGIGQSEMIELKSHNAQWYIDVAALLNLDLSQEIPFRTEIFSDRELALIVKDNDNFGNARIEGAWGVYLNDDEAISSGIRSEILKLSEIFKGVTFTEEITNATRVFAIQNDGTTSYVLTENGNLGYIQTDVVAFDDEVLITEIERPKIKLIWEYVYRKTPDPSKITNLEGINVISPTWYALTDAEGTVSNISSAKYTQWTKEHGYEIWPLVSNSFDPELTHEFLHNASGRYNFINTLVSEAIKNNYNGINIDFENIYLEDRDLLSHFINELSWYMNQYDLILSMDVTVIAESDNWSKCFDRKTLGNIVDYLIVMAYDEHWDSSPVSGPVASFDWVASSLLQIQNLVPSNKLIMGIPLYTRVWSEKIDNSLESGYSISADAIGIADQNALIESKGLNLKWLELDKVYFTSYIEDDVVKKIWVENLDTIVEKIKLSKEMNLAGYAFWRRGMEEVDFFYELNQRID